MSDVGNLYGALHSNLENYIWIVRRDICEQKNCLSFENQNKLE